MAGAVLDASALLALLGKEPGAEKVLPHLAGGVLSSVNLGEVLSKLVDVGMPLGVAVDVIDRLGLQVVPFEREDAITLATLRPATRSLGLSVGDRACLSLAHKRGAVAVTADGAWAGVDIGVEVVLIR